MTINLENFCCTNMCIFLNNFLNRMYIIFTDLGYQLNELKEKCIKIEDEALVNLDSHKYLDEHNFRVPWDLLLEMKLSFSINTKTLKRLSPINGPECFNFQIEIKFDNSDHDGQVNEVLIYGHLKAKCYF